MESISRDTYNFYQLLVPTLLSGLAISLNEFVDSSIVAHLLGIDAMSMVGMASPIMFVFAITYCILGMGGATIYAEIAGRQEKEESKKVFTVVCLVTLVISVILTVIGLVFLDPLCDALCDFPEYLPELKPYVAVLISSGFLIIPLQVFVSFCPAFGVPQMGTIVNIMANAINLVMDVVFITVFNTGLKGAAMATFTGYLVKIAFCNQLSMELGGMSAIAVFAICIQILSIVSIGISGIVGSMIPIGAALQGQRDYNGLKMLIKSVLKIQLVFNIVMTIILELFPQLFCLLFNYDGDNVEYAYVGIRIFSTMLIFRGFILVFMFYYQIVGRRLYSMLISAIDGFIGLIPVALILTNFFGINGLWATFPVVAVLMIIGIIITNIIIRKRSNGRYTGIMLYEKEDENVPVFDVSFTIGKDSISAYVAMLRDFCEKNINDKRTSYMVALSLEEMLVFISDNKKNNKNKKEDVVDILVKATKDDVLMDIRSLGEPIDPVSAKDEKYSNIDVLKKVATKLDYNYVVGMNQTRIDIQASH